LQLQIIFAVSFEAFLSLNPLKIHLSQTTSPLNLSEELPMDLPLTLSMEQQFNMKVYEDQVRNLSSDQAQDFLLEIMRQLMIKDNVIRHLMKKAI
jgi:hypothetical protein